MIDVLLILFGVLLTLTVGAAVEYYRQIVIVKKEYKKAKETVEDIILSFNRQLKREAEKLEFVAYKVEAVSAKSDKALKRAEKNEEQMLALESKISKALEGKEEVLKRVNETDEKLRDVITSQEKLTKKVLSIEERERQLPLIPEERVEAVIPIKREKAFAPLTETELSVLEILTVEGPKTAPEIKERIKLSREHTARLMKKLYEEGYLERDTNKIPFKYRVKKEMAKLLKKTEEKI